MPNVDDRQDDEVEETTTVLLSLIDFGLKEFGDDQVSVTSEDYKVFLMDPHDLAKTEFPVFLTQQFHTKLRTWKANKELKKSANRDRAYIQKRTDAIATGASKCGKPFRKRLTLDEVKR